MITICSFYELKDFEAAFAYWQELETSDPGCTQFVVSTDFFTSGYWVENKGSQLTPSDIVYDTPEKVNDLKRRIEEEIQRAKLEGNSPKFIY